jgi:hypothetical protein
MKYRQGAFSIFTPPPLLYLNQPTYAASYRKEVFYSLSWKLQMN